MSADPDACPKCGARVEHEGAGAHAVGSQPLHQHATCPKCGTKLIRNVGDRWRVEKP